MVSSLHEGLYARRDSSIHANMDKKVASIVAVAGDSQQEFDDGGFGKKVAAIVAAGYSAEEAKVALDENDGDVDDAIDSLFLEGRKSQRNVASAPSLDDEQGVTVTGDSLAPAAAASSGTTIVAGQFSQTVRGWNARRSSRLTPSLGVAVVDSNRAASIRASSSATARISSSKGVRTSRTLKEAEPELYSPSTTPPHASKAPKGHESKEKKDRDSVEVIDASSPSAEASSRSSALERASSFTEPANDRLPGAFAVGGNSIIEQGATDDWEHNGSINQPSLREITTAELFDPDQENQILEQRLQEELVRERENAAVAEVVNESELKTCQWKRVACVVGIVLVALSIALAVSLTRAPKPATETMAPTAAPTASPPPQEIIDLIAPVSFDGGESLMDPFSPQSAAARWLAENAELASYSDQRKLQRYALATFYYQYKWQCVETQTKVVK